MPSRPGQANIAYLIEPAERRVTRVEQDGSLACWQGFIGGYVEFVPASDLGKDALLVDEEGLIIPKPHHFWQWQGFSLPLVGKGLLIGGKDGNRN